MESGITPDRLSANHPSFRLKQVCEEAVLDDSEALVSGEAMLIHR
jgi:hypothetical protein